MSSLPLVLHREISSAFLADLNRGCLAPLTRLAIRHDDTDLQIREGYVTLYFGMTDILNVHDVGGVSYRLSVEPGHASCGPDVPWGEPLGASEVRRVWQAVESYIEKIEAYIRTSATRHLKEGRVHAALCSGSDPSYFVINREAAPSFKKTKNERKGSLQGFAKPFASALGIPPAKERWWPKGGGWKPGTSPDILAVDASGRELLVIEAKPAHSGTGITWGPAQTVFYGALIDEWTHTAAAGASLATMLRQRVEIGLTSKAAPTIIKRPAIRPVLAIGTGKKADGDLSLEYLRRMLLVASRLGETSSNFTPAIRSLFGRFEVWFVDDDGRIQRKAGGRIMTKGAR